MLAACRPRQGGKLTWQQVRRERIKEVILTQLTKTSSVITVSFKAVIPTQLIKTSSVITINLKGVILTQLIKTSVMLGHTK